MTKPKVFVTCPPMLGLIDEFQDDFSQVGLDCVAAETSQVLSVEELIAEVPQYDGWIIGDDPATRAVVQAGVAGRLRAAVKWGVGTDNVDFEAFKDHDIPVQNTPGVFGNEVADVALTYALGLTRETYWIDRQIKDHKTWPKPSGISLTGRTVAIVGFGDIGRQTARRILACGSNVIVYDPFFQADASLDVTPSEWPKRLNEADLLIFTCPLNEQTKGMFNGALLGNLKPGVRVVNVGRGPVIEESALVEGLRSGLIHSAALDVFEEEPLSADSPLRSFEKCIFGSHNGSNSADAVRRVSRLAISKISGFLARG